MPFDNTLYTTRQLIGMYYDPDITDPVPNYWLQFFPGQINFDTEYVDFGRLHGQRKMAPLVVPTTQGKPMYSAAEERVQVKPAYVKPKDAVSATRVIKKLAGQGEMNYDTNRDPRARYALLVADILNTHRRGIERRWEWMAAGAVQNGQVILEDDGYPRTIVDFKRAGAHTVSLSGASQWGQVGVNALTSLWGWRNIMRTAKWGGAATRATMGTRAWEVFSADPAMMATLKTDVQPGTYNNQFNLGGLQGDVPAEWVGRINGTLDVYVYSDSYEAPDGTDVPLMDPRDVVLTSSNIQGVRCFGAIQDVAAQWQPVEVFTKMWNQEDPSATFIL